MTQIPAILRTSQKAYTPYAQIQGALEAFTDSTVTVDGKVYSHAGRRFRTDGIGKQILLHTKHGFVIRHEWVLSTEGMTADDSCGMD